MDSTKWISLTIGLLVGAIILAAFVPIFVNVQNESGEEITLTNNSAIVLREIKNGDVFELTSTRNADTSKTDVWTLNDEIITSVGGGSLGWDVGLISDAMYVRIISQANASSGATTLMSSTTGTEQYIGPANTEGVYTWTWEFTDGTMTYIDRYGTVVTAPYTWGYVVCPLEDGEYYSAETGGVGICKSADDLILCGGYTSGSLDTMYALHNGEKYVSVSDYTMDVTATTTLHTGTSDIYDITVEVAISDGNDTETFAPYRIYLPYEVTGHATKGVMFDLFGLLPLIAGVGLLLGACIEFLRRY